MRILIIRHADPEYHGDTLTAAGFKEADALAKRLSTGSENTLTHIYTSPMGRALATAAPTEKATNLPASILEWTRELTYWPRLEDAGKPGEGGRALWDIPGEVVRSTDDLNMGNQFLKGSLTAAPSPYYEDLVAASDAFIALHGYERQGGRYRIREPNRHVIAVFCHGGFGLTWLAHLLHIPLAMIWSSFYLAPSSVTTVLFDERSKEYATPRVIGLGDIGHLYAENLTLSVSKYEKPNVHGDWKRPSGIKANFY